MSGTLTPWEQPSDYAGYNPVGHLGVLAKHRDSDLLTRVNWDVACERLAKAAGLEAVPMSTGEGWWDDVPLCEQPVYYWEAGHWAVGWVQYLMVRPDAPQAVLDAAQEIVDDLADYPILDDDLYNEREMEAVDAYWKSCSIKERIDWIREADADVSIFAARRDYAPSDDSGRLDELLREGL